MVEYNAVIGDEYPYPPHLVGGLYKQGQSPVKTTSTASYLAPHPLPCCFISLSIFPIRTVYFQSSISCPTMSTPDPAESIAIGDLAIASRAGATIIASRDDVDSFMRALQRTLLFRIEWQDLLSAGPEALVHMGECFLAVHATSNPSLPLFDSPGSVPGLP